MIKMIAIPRLKLAQLQTLTESVLSLVGSIPEVSDQVTAVQTSFDQFKESLQKDQAASDKRTLDQARDRLISGLMFDVKAEDNFPYDDATVLGTIQEVRRVTDRYGMGVNRLPYNEQSAQVDNMLGELTKIDMTSTETLSRWLEPIRTANETFKSASDDYVRDVAATQQLPSATASAPGLLNELEGLFTLLVAHTQVNPTDELKEAYLQLTTLVDTYR